MIDNHFASGTPQTKSLVKRTVDSTFGGAMLKISYMMKNVKREQLAIPAFASIFLTMSLGCPTAAFAAATAAVAPAASNTYMTKLLKNVFCAGCAAVLTVTFIHPIDVVKTRIQVESNKGNSAGIGGVVKSALDTEGAGAFYKGIKPAWLREMSYSSLRIGLYDPVKILVGANNPGASFLQKFLAGAIAGAIGCTAGNPFDILKTKMMADKEAKNKGIGEYASEIMKF